MATLRGKVLLSRLQDGFAAAPGPVLRRALSLSLIMLVFFIIQSPVIFEFVAERADAVIQDYLPFHVASEKALAGEGARLYDPDYFHSLITQEHGFLWFYAPTMFLFLAPFGLAPYGAAKFLWLGASIAAVAAGARWLTRKNLALILVAATSPAAWSLMKTGQFSAFFTLLACAGLLMSKTRPVLAGVLLGVLTLKPQYGLLIPVFLIVTGSWRTVFWAVTTALFSASLSLFAFGPEPWLAYIQSLTSAHADFMALDSGSGRITLLDTLRNLGMTHVSGLAVYAPALAAAAVAIIYAARRGASHRTLAALAMLLSVITAPYIWIYDWLLVAFPLLILIADGKIAGMRAQTAAAVLWYLPIASYMTESSAVVPAIWIFAAAAIGVIYCDVLGLRFAPARLAAAR